MPGLLPREAWARAFALEERRIARYRRPCGVVAVGLDGLEALSLKVGPDAAERLVGPLVETLAGRARAADLVCRIDRTRFVVLLPETDDAGARA
jgi:GGDEF domain-containing protein